MILIKIIDIIGYSGSGKTHFIRNALKILAQQRNYNVSVIKNVKHHQIDEEGKDSFWFTEDGASYSMIKNIDNKIGIFFQIKDNEMDETIKWLQIGPHNLDILLTEGFRNFNNPTVLCVSKLNEIDSQLNENVTMISGKICLKNINIKTIFNLPIIDIEKNSQKFLEVFKIE
ncbi:MAG: molybdopterin-guanine dinucleotide biosynthesis protein B [Promethearchaeota archaeon]